MAPAPGVTPPPQDGSSYRFLSDVIMARGFVEPDAMKAALQASLAGPSLTELLVERGAIAEIDLARAIAEHHRLDHLDLDAFPVDRETSMLVEAATARRLGVLPIASLPDGALVVAAHDPNDLPALREIGQLTDRAIQPAVASRSQVDAAIDALNPSAPPPMPAADDAAPEKHLRAEAVASAHCTDVLRPTAPAPIPGQARNDNERARAAKELAHGAQACAEAAEERAVKAENTIAAADARAEGLMAAATAADEALARVVGKCELLEREATAREGEMQAVRSELESERAERGRLEQQLLAPQASDELLALHVRVAELEHELDEARASAAQVQAPPPDAYAMAPAEAYDPAPAGAHVLPPAEAHVPAPAPEPVAEAPLCEPPEIEAPRPALTIDIPGDPGVPYVSALAPMSPAEDSAAARPKVAKSAAKARGLRRLVGALKRG
jgi:type II secretion system (T2SS) protein E